MTPKDRDLTSKGVIADEASWVRSSIEFEAVKTFEATQLTDPVAHHGEGPLWDPIGDRVIWVDMLAGDVLVTLLDGHTRRVTLDDPIAALVRPVLGSRHFVVAGEKTIWLLDLDGDDVPRQLGELPFADGVRANDGACSPDGVLYVGSMAYTAAPNQGDVLAWTPTGFRVAWADTTISNGTQFLADGSVIFADSADRRIRRFRVAADGTWFDPRTIAVPAESSGAPDGLCVDSEGGVWVAMWDGGCVQRWSASGQLTASIDLPVPRPTSVTLGGEGLRTLFISTSALDQPTGAAIGAGALFAAQVEVPGMPAYGCLLPNPGIPPRSGRVH